MALTLTTNPHARTVRNAAIFVGDAIRPAYRGVDFWASATVNGFAGTTTRARLFHIFRARRTHFAEYVCTVFGRDAVRTALAIGGTTRFKTGLTHAFDIALDYLPIHTSISLTFGVFCTYIWRFSAALGHARTTVISVGTRY